MRVLVTGATGYLGGHVAARLVAAGHEVAALVRPGGSGRAPAACRPVEADLFDAGALARALSGRDAVVHLAALVRTWARDRRAFDRVNVGGLAAVLRAAATAGVPRIVYTSTIVALGPTDGEVRDESAGRTDFRFHTDYERTKWLAERLAREQAAAGAPIVTVYPGVVYGPGAPTQGNLLRGTLEAYLRGRLSFRLGRSDLRICYAYVGDVAEGHRLALERGVAGRGYILGGDNATQDRLFAVLQQLTGIRPPRFAVPYAAAETVGLAQRLLAALTGVTPRLTEGVVSTFRHEWAYSSERAIREIGYRVTPIEEGLRVTVEDLQHAPGGACRGGT